MVGSHSHCTEMAFSFSSIWVLQAQKDDPDTIGFIHKNIRKVNLIEIESRVGLLETRENSRELRSGWLMGTTLKLDGSRKPWCGSPHQENYRLSQTARRKDVGVRVCDLPSSEWIGVTLNYTLSLQKGGEG